MIKRKNTDIKNFTVIIYRTALIKVAQSVVKNQGETEGNARNVTI